MTTQGTKDTAKSNGHGNANGVFELLGQNQLPQEFITIGRTFEDALGRCTLRDDKQKSAVVTYKDQMEMFLPKMLPRIQALTNWLNASSAVGGINKNLAVMAHTGIVIPEMTGTKLSKQGSKEYIESQHRRDEQQKRENDNDNHNH